MDCENLGRTRSTVPSEVPEEVDGKRYPEGKIRDMHRVNGQETYALVVGNVYGLPTAGRTFAKERNRLLLEELPMHSVQTGANVYGC